MSRVAIVINNYNYGRFLGQCIESALKQTRPPDELIVVDDGSTDESREVIVRFGDRLTPILQANQGQAAALNAGFRASSADLVLFLDSDDYLYPEALDTCLRHWEAGASKLHFRLDRVDREGRQLGETWPKKSQDLPSGNLVDQLAREGRFHFPPTSGNLFARACLEKLFPIPAERYAICADAYLIIKAVAHGAQLAVDRSLGAYRIHGGNHFFERQRYLDPSQVRKHFENSRNVRELVNDVLSECGRPPYSGQRHHTDYTNLILAKRLFGDSIHPQQSRRELLDHMRQSLRRLPVSRRKRAFIALYGALATYLPIPLLRAFGRSLGAVFPKWFSNQ